ncbi:MAG: hypothetical protein FWH01_05150 [Oscillospiraceae bacterium]|nr:hypothetical protein [Oscillospiraceae bacterium]
MGGTIGSTIGGVTGGAKDSATGGTMSGAMKTSHPTIMKVVGSGKRGSPHLTSVKRPHGALRRDSVHDSILSCHVGGGTVVTTIT